MKFPELEIGEWFTFNHPTDRLGRYEKLSETEYSGSSNTLTVTSLDVEVTPVVWDMRPIEDRG